MGKRSKKYRRCKVCKELIAVRHDNCPNCENRNKLAGYVPVYTGGKSRPTIDTQEGNFQ